MANPRVDTTSIARDSKIYDTPVQFFKGGSLWLPVKPSGDSALIPPLFEKGDFGGLMPVIQFNAPDFWDSTIIPYENIVDFDFTIMGDGSSTNPSTICTMTFIDQTPIFIEELIRRVRNSKVDGSSNGLSMRFGWRLTTIPTQLKQPTFINHIENNLLLSREYKLLIIGATYKFSNYGVMCQLKMSAEPKTILSGLTTNIKNQDMLARFTGGNVTAQSLCDALTDIINQSKAPTFSKIEYKVVLLDKSIRTNLADTPDQKISAPKGGDLSLLDLVSQVVDTFYVMPKPSPDGKVKFYISETPVTETDVTGTKTFYPIYVVSSTAYSDNAQYFPLLEYPAYETSILSWQPSFSNDAAENVFMIGERITTIDQNGNATTVVDKAAASSAGHISAQDGKELNSVEAPKNQLTRNKAAAAIATLAVEIPGDPMLTDMQIFNQKFLVRNNGISQQGMVRNPSDFFSNFPGLQGKGGNELKSLKLTLDQISAESPFNGYYHLSGWSHKIKVGDGYKTSLNFKWKEIE